MRNTGLRARMAVAGTILFGFYAALAAFAYRLGIGLPIIAVGSLLFVAAQYKIGRWAALRSVRADPLPESQFGDIHETVEDLSVEMGIEKPTLMLAEMGAPNAFAVGRQGDATVVVSKSLLAVLETDEIDSVLAHELAHVKNRDVVLMVLGQSIASLVGFAVQFVVLFSEDAGWILSWILGTIAQMIVTLFVLVISRHREYVADEVAAEHTSSASMASALATIESVNTAAEATPTDEVSALCISGGKRGLLAKLFASHPSTEKRIARLGETVSTA
jgi:heat shock protein HtpX